MRAHHGWGGLDWSTISWKPYRPFPSSLVPLFQSESKCEPFHMKMSSACSFILMQIKVIFIRMVSHLDSLWNRGTRELGNGLLFPVSNLKMFCSSCGQNCLLEAKYCQKCGDLLKQNVTEGAGSVDVGSVDEVPLEATGFFYRSQVTFSLLLSVLTCIRTPPCFSNKL